MTLHRLLVAAGLMMLMVPASAPAAPSLTFTYSGAPQGFSVPSGVNQLLVHAVGAPGSAATATPVAAPT